MTSFRRALPVSTTVRRLPGVLATPPAEKPARRKVPELTGAPVWWLIGPNGAGKTLVARWLLERAMAGGRDVKAAALDVNTRTLAEFFGDGIAQPDAADPVSVAAWMRSYLGYMAELRLPAVLDMGGGDQALAHLIASTPKLIDIMTDQGQAPVAAYFLTPRDKDLDALATFEAAGFQPKNTVLIFNESLATDPDMVFAPIAEHPTVKSAVARGAVLLRLPRLFKQDVAIRMESSLLTFREAGAGRTDAGEAVPLDSFEQADVRFALDRLAAVFEPLAGWLP